MSFLRVRNWEHYQNADVFKKAKGKPPWVKLYTAMLDDRDLLALDPVTQLLFDRLLLLAAKNANAISNDSQWIANTVGIDHGLVVKGIGELLKGAWLSETKTKRSSRKIREAVAKDSLQEVEVEVDKTPLPPFQLNPLKCRVCGLAFKTPRRLEEHLENVHDIEAAPVVAITREAS